MKMFSTEHIEHRTIERRTIERRTIERRTIERRTGAGKVARDEGRVARGQKPDGGQMVFGDHFSLGGGTLYANRC